MVSARLEFEQLVGQLFVSVSVELNALGGPQRVGGQDKGMERVAQRARGQYAGYFRPPLLVAEVKEAVIT